MNAPVSGTGGVAGGLWRRLWMPTDAELLDAGASGEMLIARVRLVLAVVLTIVPLHQVVLGPGDVENYVGLGVMLVAVALAIGLLVLVRRDLYRPWYGFLTASIDVSLVSLVLALFIGLGRPLTATNSRVVFEFYFLAIAATCLRYDPRVTIVAGALAVAQYAAITLWAAGRYPLDALVEARLAYGSFSWGSQISRLVLLAVASALAWSVVARMRRLRRLSTLDRLTGLYNRTHFLERMEEEVSRTRRYRRPMAVALIDLDDFMAFNDAHGHLAGDKALGVFGSFLRRAVRRTDIIARYGDDEFVVVLPETPAAAAREKLEAMRSELATIPMAGRDGAPAYLTISAGLASWPADGDNVTALLEKADDRLFDAKREGRNRVAGGGEPAAGQIVVAGTMQRISREVRG